jgi:uncharacterized protein (TIGR02145 family)
LRDEIGDFSNSGSAACFWSSSHFDETNAMARIMFYFLVDVNYSEYQQLRGLSVRCIRDY